MDRDAANGARYQRGSDTGHYESWFLRANHPTRPDAFWIRYTIFAPAGRPDAAEGELWAIIFREGASPVSVKTAMPIAECTMAASGLDVRMRGSTLSSSVLSGRAQQHDHTVEWNLAFQGGSAPLTLLPERLYAARFPSAKALVPVPGCTYWGEVRVDGEVLEVEGWRGSQNHNWGSRHTDAYAWGQVAGFPAAPEAFLEVSTARVKLGPVSTPWLTPIVWRDENGDEHRLSGILRALRNRGSYRVGVWSFSGRGEDGFRIRGRMEAPPTAFVALPYRNPPGGVKTCFNCKVARCELEVEQRGRPSRRWVTAHGAAFEVLR